MKNIKSEARDIFKQNLSRYMDMRGINQAHVVSKLGVTASTVSDWVNGTKYPRVDAMQRLADLLGVSMGDLTDKPDERFSKYPNILPIKRKKVRLLGSIAAGVPIYAEEDHESYVLADEDVHCDFALRVEGDSMIPRLQSGDIVFLREQSDVDDGEIAAVIVDDSATLKHVYHIPGGVQLVSDNPKYRPMIYTAQNSDYLRIIGKAVAYQRDL